jgi:mycothiol synthase
MLDSRITSFLEQLTLADGTPPLSEAKLSVLSDDERTLIVEEDGQIVAVAVAAHHGHADGTGHWSVECALAVGLRFREFEDRLLRSALDLVPPVGQVTVWSHRRSLDKALVGAGFGITRELGYLSIHLPIGGEVETISTRPFAMDDTAEILDLNRVAFASHREASSLDEHQFHQLLGQLGMGPADLLVLEEFGEIRGFCWTRVHDNGNGEIYRIAVSPQNQGRGVGRMLLLAGFDHLARRGKTSNGVLWVDLSNEKALRLYEGIGMTLVRSNREFGMLSVSG